MNYELLESQIVERVASFAPTGVEVVAFPENNADFVKPFEGAHISVLYKGSRYGDGAQSWTRSTAQHVQLETVRVDLIIRSRFLRGADYGCLPLLKTVRTALVGYMPDNCDRVYMTGSEMIFPSEEQPGDIFTYVCTFEATSLAVEAWDDTTGDMATITQITLNSEYGNVQVS